MDFTTDGIALAGSPVLGWQSLPRMKDEYFEEESMMPRSEVKADKFCPEADLILEDNLWETIARTKHGVYFLVTRTVQIALFTAWVLCQVTYWVLEYLADIGSSY